MQKHVSLTLQVSSFQNSFLLLKVDALPEGILPGSYLLFANDAQRFYISNVDQTKSQIEVFAPAYAQTQDRMKAELVRSDTSLCEPGQPVLVTAGVTQLGAFIFAARALRKLCNAKHSLFVLYSENTFPFQPVPSKFVVSAVPSHVIAGMPMLEDWGLPTRLVSDAFVPGAFDGSVDELLSYYLEQKGCAAGNIYVLNYAGDASGSVESVM